MLKFHYNLRRFWKPISFLKKYTYIFNSSSWSDKKETLFQKKQKVYVNIYYIRKKYVTQEKSENVSANWKCNLWSKNNTVSRIRFTYEVNSFKHFVLLLQTDKCFFFFLASKYVFYSTFWPKHLNLLLQIFKLKPLWNSSLGSVELQL